MSTIDIFIGTVYGAASSTADSIAKILEQNAHQPKIADSPMLDVFMASQNPIIICTSTTGSGEIPAGLLQFYVDLQDHFPLQPNRAFGVVTLGDSSYSDTFGAAGAQMENILLELQATPIIERLTIDACETSDPETAVVPWALQYAAAISEAGVNLGDSTG